MANATRDDEILLVRKSMLEAVVVRKAVIMPLLEKESKEILNTMVLQNFRTGFLPKLFLSFLGGALAMFVLHPSIMELLYLSLIAIGLVGTHLADVLYKVGLNLLGQTACLQMTMQLIYQRVSTETATMRMAIANFILSGQTDAGRIFLGLVLAFVLVFLLYVSVANGTMSGELHEQQKRVRETLDEILRVAREQEEAEKEEMRRLLKQVPKEAVPSVGEARKEELTFEAEAFIAPQKKAVIEPRKTFTVFIMNGEGRKVGQLQHVAGGFYLPTHVYEVMRREKSSLKYYAFVAKGGAGKMVEIPKFLKHFMESTVQKRKNDLTFVKATVRFEQLLLSNSIAAAVLPSKFHIGGIKLQTVGDVDSREGVIYGNLVLQCTSLGVCDRHKLVVYHTANTDSGDSGAPMIDPEGRLCGLHLGEQRDIHKNVMRRLLPKVMALVEGEGDLDFDGAMTGESAYAEELGPDDEKDSDLADERAAQQDAQDMYDQRDDERRERSDESRNNQSATIIRSTVNADWGLEDSDDEMDFDVPLTFDSSAGEQLPELDQLMDFTKGAAKAVPPRKSVGCPPASMNGQKMPAVPASVSMPVRRKSGSSGSGKGPASASTSQADPKPQSMAESMPTKGSFQGLETTSSQIGAPVASSEPSKPSSRRRKKAQSALLRAVVDPQNSALKLTIKQGGMSEAAMKQLESSSLVPVTSQTVPLASLMLSLSQQRAACIKDAGDQFDALHKGELTELPR